jgi:hypothetical protein
VSELLGQWSGTAEVYDGDGRFIANATDQRHVRTEEDDGRIRIDLAFIGPFKMAGHYFIEEHEDRRLYQGPINVGYGEPLGPGLVDANAYWAAAGLSQRLFLCVLPGSARQVSLALMSRGERVLYVVVGEHARVQDDTPSALPGLVTGASCDLANDPAAGHGDVLLHREGTWSGELTVLDAERKPNGTTAFREEVTRDADGNLALSLRGRSFAPEPVQCSLHTDERQAWSGPGDLVGSYSLAGGRALSGHFHDLGTSLRVWRREVATSDGAMKVVLHTWYRGGVRVGVEHGVLRFE